jgi:tRNA(Ile)-lysidine synthase
MCPEFKSLHWHFLFLRKPLLAKNVNIINQVAVVHMSQQLIFSEIEYFFETFVPRAPAGKAVCVAVSGGCDSIALFRTLFGLQEKLGIVRLGIAHVNHKLRGSESDGDAAFVKQLSVTSRVPFHEKILKPRIYASGMEAWARTERYDFFHDLRTAEGYDYVATGHTADDQAETVLMRIMRGCGLKGLRGIAPIREDNVIRPFLHVQRAWLSTWLKEIKAAYREDSSNKNITYRRNLVRLKLLPALLNSAQIDAMILPKIAQAARSTWESLVGVLNNWSDLNVVSRGIDQFAIKKCGLIDFPFADEAIAEVLRTKGIRFDTCHIHDLITNLKREDGFFLLPGGWYYRFRRELIEFSRHAGERIIADVDAYRVGDNRTLRPGTDSVPYPFRYDLIPGGTVTCENANVSIEMTHAPFESGRTPSFDNDNLNVMLDADRIRGPMELRTVMPDDVFQPLGCGQPRKVKEYLKKLKIDFKVRGIVAEKNGNVLWIPGVQISHLYRVTQQTTAVLKFSCKPL